MLTDQEREEILRLIHREVVPAIGCTDDDLAAAKQYMAGDHISIELEEEDPLSLSKVYDFATTTPLDELRFILESKRLNEEAAADGLRENYGHRLGKTMCSPLGRGIIEDDVDRSIHNLTSIGSRGMDETDRFVLDIMTHKQ